MARPIRVLSRVAYRTSVENGQRWRQIDYCANKLVKALKGEPINGHLEIRVNRVRKRFDQANVAELLPVIHSTMAARLATEIEGNFTLVPVPNKRAVIGVDDFPTRTSAEAIAGLLGGRVSVSPCLRWKARLAKARDGGPRDADVLADHLEMSDLPDGPIVLYDDMFTSGGHIAACSRVIAEAGNMPDLAMTFGWAADLVVPSPLEWREQILETEPQDIDWASFIFDDV